MHKSLTDVGDFEYQTIRPVLKCVPSAEQLYKIEQNSPQIQGEDAELWQAFIARDIPNWRTKNYKPKKPRNWYQIYFKYKKEQQQEIARDEEILRQSMLGLKRERETHVSKVVDLKSLPKIPRDPRMIANNGGVPLKGKTGFKKAPPSALTWTAGSKTKLTDGKSVLTRARREAKEMTQRGKLATPTGQLNIRHGQVKQAPAAMVTEYRTAAQPPLKILSRKHGVGGIKGGIRGPSLEEREARLRAAMAGGSSTRQTYKDPKATYVGSSDDEDDSGLEDLFDSKPKQQNRSASSRRLSSPPSIPLSSSSRLPLTSESSKAGSSRPIPRALSPPPASSQMTNAALGPKPMMARKRPQVDIFNRGASKKPRQR
ncbi:RNA polymerase II transcription factor SIII subunit A [Coleophoma crateriformis]|uniref:RNA polymerase II transcription factor SIII subunit A n=1 Tax=Coleophoma crateriformis TaxID=565419 RepID=A0A3D8RVK8_9HELO|nr:RNA polymerase II transcription factor SIII subunit A [Coleophoma crateriformis]